MGKTLDLGRRLELQPTDVHCRDISIALYEREVEGRPRVLVHTYSNAAGADERVAYIRQALIVMLGMVASPQSPWIEFPCGRRHERALKRAFLDLCKLETGAPLDPKPLTGPDKKAECDLSAESLGRGVYETKALADTDKGARRATALARGYLKLCEMVADDANDRRGSFACGQSHDALMGMLMFRAQNVRSAMQEEETAAGRGVLSSPSQQK